MQTPLAPITIAATCLILLSGCNNNSSSNTSPSQAELSTKSLNIIIADKLKFKDHNNNGILDPYEDWRLSPEERAADLVKHLTVKEKAGIMMHATLVINDDNRIEVGTDSENYELIANRYINTLITRQAGEVNNMATDNNSLQALAETTAHGIPLSISTDPRNHFDEAFGGSHSAGEFSMWPETLGLAALDDIELTKRFADIIRQEYLAVGINQALHPTADIATEPRWGRNYSTFGEDAYLAKRMTQAYTQGLQNSDTGLTKNGVWAVVKHYAGGGPQKDGIDAHHYIGRHQVYPGDNFHYHRIPFQGAFEAGIAGVMPYYGIPVDQLPESEGDIAFGFSSYVMTDLLRGEDNFEGVLVSDWMVAEDCNGSCRTGIRQSSDWETFSLGMPWGLEDEDKTERFARSVDAGIDQFGGIDDPSHLIDAINSDRISEERIDISVKRILQQKFKQGIFENPFVDVEKAIEIVGNAEFQREADRTQRRSFTLLKNDSSTLPISVAKMQRVFLYGIDKQAAQSYGLTVVDTIDEADTVLLRVTTPGTEWGAWVPFGSINAAGELAFVGEEDFSLRDYELAADPDQPDASICYDPDQYEMGHCEYTGFDDYTAIQEAINSNKTVILDVKLHRAGALGNIEPELDTIIANYGASDEAFLDVITGVYAPEGKLPFGLPVSTDAVIELGKEDVPSFELPAVMTLFPFGHGLNY
ncbi:glycoside hydrolase family 3 N-terminal domain-containing protein [Photobacterium satsumensis]|uniref:glycoside hydrolase family 3 protein n=1 Tax=Photobacterium satsumensis TaxID=2910239 RepID=UPI003D105E72